jgi:hypothetical protein
MVAYIGRWDESGPSDQTDLSNGGDWTSTYGVGRLAPMASGPHLQWHAFSCLLDSSKLGFDAKLISFDSGLQIEQIIYLFQSF